MGFLAMYTINLSSAYDNVQGGPEKIHEVYGILILQPCVADSCAFQQNV